MGTLPLRAYLPHCKMAIASTSPRRQHCHFEHISDEASLPCHAHGHTWSAVKQNSMQVHPAFRACVMSIRVCNKDRRTRCIRVVLAPTDGDKPSTTLGRR